MEQEQARARKYSGAVVLAVQETMRETGLTVRIEKDADPTIPQLARLSAHANVAPSIWFPLRSTIG